MYVHVIHNEFCTYVKIVTICIILNSTKKKHTYSLFSYTIYTYIWDKSILKINYGIHNRNTLVRMY